MARQVIDDIGGPDLQVTRLVELADRLAGTPRDDAMSTAARLTRDIAGKELAWALQRVLPRLDPGDRAALIDATFERVLKLNDADADYDIPRPVALLALAPWLNGEQLQRALTVARGMLRGIAMLQDVRAEVLARLAIRYPTRRRSAGCGNR